MPGTIIAKWTDMNRSDNPLSYSPKMYSIIGPQDMLHIENYEFHLAVLILCLK